jgi:hypothetical protein
MKKSLWIVGLVMALTVGVVVPAFAAGEETPPGPGWRQGGGEGPLHDLMIEAAAGVLGLEPADLEARLESGETLWQVALDEGLSADEFRLEWTEARRAVMENAVAEGLIERTQVRQMLGLRAQMRDSECPGLGGFRNSPQGQ